MVKPIKNQKSKRKRGKKFVFFGDQQEQQKNEKKANPFEEFSRKNHMKIGNQYDGLIKEYNQRYNSNKFIDKRIGEGSKSLTEDEKMQLRFKSVQKTKSSKKSKFDINSDSENEMNNLTHKGKNLKEIEDYNEDNDVLSEEDSDRENRQRSSLNYLEEIDKNPNLSRKEIIQNMIMNSKKEKIEKQKAKELNQEKIKKLDDEFTDLLGLVQKRKKTILRSSDPYDKYAASLLYAKRTKPTDRVKSEEELALEKKNMLEKLEKERLSRIKNNDVDKNEDEEEEDDEEKHPDKIDTNQRTLTKKERIEKLIQKRLSKSAILEEKDNLIERKRERENNEKDDDDDDLEEGEDEESQIDNASDLDGLDDEEYEEDDDMEFQEMDDEDENDDQIEDNNNEKESNEKEDQLNNVEDQKEDEEK